MQRIKYQTINKSCNHSKFLAHFFNAAIAAFTLGTSSSFFKMSGSGPIGVI